MPQTDFEQYTPVGREGALADLETRNIVTGAGASDIKFGRVVVMTDDDGVKVGVPVGADAGKVVKGIAVAIQNSHVIGENSGYKEKDSVSIIRQGVVWMRANGAVKAGDKVFYITSVAEKAGEVGASETAGGGTSNTELSGAVFSTAGADGTLVKLTINLP